MVADDSLTSFDGCLWCFSVIEEEGMILYGFMVSPAIVLRYQQQMFATYDGYLLTLLLARAFTIL